MSDTIPAVPQQLSGGCMCGAVPIRQAEAPLRDGRDAELPAV